MKYFTAKETRKWSKTSVQRMCVFNNFYTCGDNEEYYELLFFVEHYKPTLQNLILAAQDIYEHSDIENLMERYNEDEKAIFENILFNLEDCVVTTFEANETLEPTYGIRKANAHIRKA